MRQAHDAPGHLADEGWSDERAYLLSLTAPQLARGDPLAWDGCGSAGAQGPGPGHSPNDRSMVMRIDPTSPDGFTVTTF